MLITSNLPARFAGACREACTYITSRAWPRHWSNTSSCPCFNNRYHALSSLEDSTKQQSRHSVLRFLMAILGFHLRRIPGSCCSQQVVQVDIASQQYQTASHDESTCAELDVRTTACLLTCFPHALLRAPAAQLCGTPRLTIS